MPDLKIVLLIFGIIFLAVLLTRKAVKKVNKDRQDQQRPATIQATPEKKRLTDEQFNKTWKSLSYLLLLAAAGSLYMVYTGVRDALASGLFIFWIETGFSLLAAVAAIFIWRKRTKLWVFLYFIFTLVPIIMFMSIKNYKVNALIHLFPLVLLYFVLQPVWENFEN